MKRVGIAFLLAGLLITVTVAAAEPKSLVRLTGLSAAQRQAILRQGYDVPRITRTALEVVLTPAEAESFRASGVKVTPVIEDLDRYVARVQKTQKNGVEYYTFDRLSQQLKTWSESHPAITRLHSIGKSCEGRDIWALKVSDHPELDEKEPAALIMGGTHAREWIGVEMPMAAIARLLQGYGTDETLTRLVDEREIWFVPVVNPDGLVYSQTQSKYWRKNRRVVDGRPQGVDLNRNFGYKWGNTGASNSPSSDTYHGTGPFSEPETQAIRDLAEREHFQGSISFHSYSELVLHPFGYAYNVPCPDEKTLITLAREMAKFNGYTAQNSADLYPAMGDSDDWLYGQCRTLAFTFELATTFIPAATQIAAIADQNVPAVFHLIDKCGTYGLTTPTGDATLARHADFRTALDAVVDGSSLLRATPAPDGQAKIGSALRALGIRLADLVADDLARGRHDSEDALRATPAAAFVLRMLADRQAFDRAHAPARR